MPKSASVFDQYASDVIAGTVPAGELVRLACERHLRDMQRDVSADWPWIFDHERAQTVVEFFPVCITHSKGRWSGDRIQLAPWQQFICGSVFGWRHHETGLRRFRSAYISVARKNGKTTMAAGLALWAVGPEKEPGAQVFVIATKEDQARILVDEGRAMVAQSDILQANGYVCYAKSIAFQGQASIRPLGRDSKSQDGWNPSLLLADEVHAMESAGLIDVIESGMGSREQPLSIYITTRGEYWDGSPCVELDDRAQHVLKGTAVDDRFFAFIASIDEGDDWRDPAVLAKANPNLAVSMSLDGLLEQQKQAIERPAKEIEFRRKRCNQWTGSKSRWIDLLKWMEQPEPIVDEDIWSWPCYAGLDLSQRSDLTSLTLVFVSPDGCYDVRPFFWIPSEGLDEREKDGGQWRVWFRSAGEWADQNRLIEGEAIDYYVLTHDLIEILQRCKDLRSVSYDKWQMVSIEQHLARENVSFPMHSIRQGYADFSPVMNEIDTWILEGKIRHDRNPVMNFCVGNAVVQWTSDSRFRRPAKPKKSAKIDGVVTMTMAMISLKADAALWEGPRQMGAIWV